MKSLRLITLFLILGLHFSGISQVSREWTVVASYPIPGKASGLAWDGTYLYSGLYSSPGDDNLVYRIDPSDGTYNLQCAGPFVQAYGLTFDGTYLWTTDHPSSSQPANAICFDMSGNQVTTFALPATYMSGIAWDNNRFWACAYYNPDGMTYKLNSTGGIITQFPSPNLQPWDICRQNEFLWVADYNANMLYKTDTLGNTLESHPSVGLKPSGVVYDGQFLWYCDGELQAQSTLYKIDLGGSGTPEIFLPENEHDYGIVTIGESSTWNMNVENTGDGDLVITGLLIPDAAPVFTTFTPPQTITPGHSISIPLTYQPAEPIPLNTEITVVSTDPVDPEVPVYLTGNAVLNGPHLLASETTHDYGTVRMEAWTRWFLYISNNGSGTLTVGSINITSENFILDGGTVFPLNISSLDTARVGVWFNPENDIQYAGSMEITHNGTNENPYIIDLAGAGIDQDYPIGDLLWYYVIDVDYDNSPKAIVPIEDVTGDKESDVIVSSEDDILRCFNGNSHNLADVIWERPIYAGCAYGQNSLTVIDDIDGDTYQEVIIGTAWGDRSVTAFSGKTGEQIWKYDTHEYGDGGWVYQVDARFDYNNDGVKDVLAATGDDANDTGPRRIFCLDATDGGKIWECFTGGPNFAIIGVEDFTGDNIPDAVAGASNNSESQGKVYGINGSNGAISWTYTTEGSSVWAVEQLLDINNDGVRDVAAGDFSGHILYLDGTDGSVIATGYIGNHLILRFEWIEDVNSDSHPDILVANSGINTVMLNGLTAESLWQHPMPDKPWNLAAANDLNGDGISDVMVGTLYSNNYLFFLDGITGDELESISFGEAVDAINAIPDIVGDGSYEMVAGGREGALNCYSGGIHSLASAPENHAKGKDSFHSFAWPNPSSEQVSITFFLPSENSVVVDIFTAGGKRIGTIHDQRMKAGEHTVTWDGKDLSGSVCTPGYYIYSIQTTKARSSGGIIRQ